MNGASPLKGKIDPMLVTKISPSITHVHLKPYRSAKATKAIRLQHGVAYALDRQRNVIDFVVGRRTIATLRQLTDGLLASGVKEIRTDRLTHYQRLIPKDRHHRSIYGINHIERKNLTLRTHVKRLSRRTICFSRKLAMLESCLRIYFWRGQAA